MENVFTPPRHFYKHYDGGWGVFLDLTIFHLQKLPKLSVETLFLAALTLISEWEGEGHFRVLTQRVTFET